VNNIDDFITELSRINLPACFNPYRDTCSAEDRHGAPAIRCANLRLFLTAAIASETKSLWIGRDLGYRGGRRTGIPLTDEVRLPLLGARVGISGFQKATRTDPVAETTAATVWSSISGLREVPVLWNAFPYHPHRENVPASNRPHRPEELAATQHLLLHLLAMLQPLRIIALGADAHEVLSRLGHSAIRVRHPSFGGQPDFRLGIQAAYGP
jgi:hypothetical protein